jgi:hypothetical protein
MCWHKLGLSSQAGSVLHLDQACLALINSHVHREPRKAVRVPRRW